MAEDTSSSQAPPPVSGADIRTFLFADMRGYTRFTQEHGDEAASELAGRFADLVRHAVPEFEGELLELRGDEALCVFRSARQALRASVELQRRLRTATDEQSAFAIGVGMGLDAGEAVPTQGGYRGASLNLAARLCALAKPGEILASETVIGLASRVEGLRFGPRRLLRLKGISEPVRAASVIPEAPLPALTLQRATRRARWPFLMAAAVVLGLLVLAVGLGLRGGGSSMLRVSEDAFTQVNPDGQVGTTGLLRESPFGVVITGQRAWLPLYSRDELLRVDTKTGQGQAIQVGLGPDAAAAGRGAIWVANSGDGTVSEVNPTAGQAVGKPIYVGNGPSGIAVGSSVWVTLSVDGAIAKIDPKTGRVVDTFPVGTDPTKVAYGYNTVWVTNESVGTVTPVDPVHDVALQPIPVGGGPNGIAVGGGGVWVTNSLDGTVTKINPRTRRVSQVLPAGVNPQGVAVARNVVWVAARGSEQIMRIDAASGRPLPPLRLAAPPQDVASEGGSTVITTAASPGAHRGGTLTVAMAQHLHTSIDPQSVNAWALQPWEMLTMTNDGLVSFKRVPGPDGETVVADLARSLPTLSNGGRTYTFQLRKEITYSTGRPIQPADFRYAIERLWTDDGKNGVDGTFFSDIRGASSCTPKRCDLNSGIVVDNATRSVTFNLTRPDPDFLAKLAMPLADAIPPQVPQHDTGTHPVPATGPYMITSYQPTKGAVLIRNPRFHEWSGDAQPDGYPNRIVWHVYPEPGDDITAVERGVADWLSNEGPPAANRVREMETTYAAQLHVSLFPSTEMLGIASSALATDPTGRRALAYAIDRNQIVSRLGGPLQAQPTCQILPPNFPGHRPYCPFTIQPANGKWTAPNIALAKKLARHSKSYGAKVTVQPDSTFSTYIVHVLNELGYKARLAPLPKGNAPPTWDIGLFSFLDDYPGAADFITTFQAPLSARDVNAAYAAQGDSQYKGTLAWAAADRRMTDYAQIIGLATDKTIGFTSKRVGNYLFSPAPGNDPLIDQMWVK